MKRDSLHLTRYQFTCLNVYKVLGLSPSGLQERLSVRWKNGIRAAELSCQVCQWWTTQVGMRLVPPLLYWSSGSGRWSKVSTVLKPSRKWIRGGQRPKVGVKAWLLLGRAFGRPPAMSPLTWASAQGLAGQKVSLAPTHWWQYHVEGSFQFSWSSSYLGTSTTNSSQANQETSTWRASRGFNVHRWPEPSHAGVGSLALVGGMCHTLSALLSWSSSLLLPRISKMKNQSPNSPHCPPLPRPWFWRRLFYMLIN